MSVRMNKLYLDHLLLNRGMSARDLAKATGLSEPTIYNVMAGKPFSSDTLGQIATFLNVPAGDLIGERPVSVVLGQNGEGERVSA